ncbi:TPA: NAD-dependent epimerase/dehydratase family protein [Candidatus Poribacteria bacterium]|nr:NAD-dependent epimerase/dehydratase family protein [Candidatus Poribacteria bacterium]
MDPKSKTVLITGCAGFIGAKITELLLKQSINVIGIDNINNFYSPILKEWRLKRLKKFVNFKFYKLDIVNLNDLREVFQQNKFSALMNLAARAGVRASVDNPWVYVDTNITGTLNLLELSKDFGIKKFVLASTSSIYGANETPFSENDKTDKQLSPYAATKKSAEALAYTYHYLYGIDITILRYFTVYGPAGRPDMMPFKFIHHIAEGIPIPVYGDGNQERDFTYIDDIARGSILSLKPLGYEVINLGSDRPIKVNYVIQLMEQYLGKKAIIDYQPIHSADVPVTWANISKAREILSWNSNISIEDGILNTVNWYLENRDWLKDIKF